MIDLADDETHGRYPGVFDYRFRVFEMDVGTLNYWAFLIWDRIIVTAHFHDPWSCQCEDCTSAVAGMEEPSAHRDREVFDLRPKPQPPKEVSE